MMNFSNLLVHSTEVYTRSDVNTAGRIAQTWTKVGTIPCRFSAPVTTRASPVAGASLGQIDATIYAGHELLTVADPVKPPLRFITTEPAWSGTYEMRNHPRMICAGTDAVHHTECDVVKVQEDA